MKVSFFVFNLASNPIVRAWPLAEAAKDLGLEIEILGFLREGEDIYKPYRDKCKFKVLYYKRYRQIFTKAKELANLASGDLIYCCKPRLDTVLPSIHASGFGRRKSLFLDVEDNELWTPMIPIVDDTPSRLRWFWAVRWKIFAHLLLRLCKYTASVSTTGLQKRYGGQIILHGPDGKVFNPALAELEPTKAKEIFKISKNRLSILFAGMAQKHKGFDLIIDAVTKLDQYKLVLAGNPEWDDFKNAKRKLGDRCISVGMVDNSEMPLLLAAVDVVAVPQRLNDFTRFQMPAKLLEAMAMGKGVLVSNVADLPEIINAESTESRGWVCKHDDLSDLLKVLEEIKDQPHEIVTRGNRAREYFIENASREAISKRMSKLFHCKLNES